MNELKKNFTGLKLVILGYGDGDLKEYLTGLSRSLGLKTYAAWEGNPLNENYDVYFTGFLSNPYSLISRSKIFLFPSISEGLGNALIEAMACGVPVVSSDCKTGPRDILSPDSNCNDTAKIPEQTPHGILMPAFDGGLKRAEEPLTPEEELWLNTVKGLLSSSEKIGLLAVSARKRAADFDAEKIIESWMKIIEN